MIILSILLSKKLTVSNSCIDLILFGFKKYPAMDTECFKLAHKMHVPVPDYYAT